MLHVRLITATIVFILCIRTGHADQIDTRSLVFDGKQRAYFVQKPDRQTLSAVPMVLVLHGGGGNGRGTLATYGLKPMVDRGEMIAVFPDAVGGAWAIGGVPKGDGRLPGPEHDDVGFLDAVVADSIANYPIDPSRLFVTGASRGGLMTQYYLPRSRHRFRAAGSVIATSTRSIAESFLPDYPLDFGMIIGTEDPLMPFNGVPHPDPRSGSMAVDAIVPLLRRAVGASEQPELETTLGNAARGDGCTNTLTVWRNPSNGARLALLVVIGGGHVAPGGRQYLPASLIGRACRDFHHAQAMWQFFKEARHR